MKKSYFKTVVALIVLGALWGSFTYYSRRKAKETAKTETKPEEKIVPVDASHIESFTITPRDGEAFTLSRVGKNWTIEKPRQLSADSGQVTSFLSSLTGVTVQQVVDPHPANVKDFGLDPPGTTIRVTTNGNPHELTLALGDTTPTQDGVYAQIAGNPRIIQLASYEKTSLEKNLFDLRDRRMVTVDPDQINRIEVSSKSKSYTLEKNPEGVWDLVLPPAVRADKFAVQSLLGELHGPGMQSVVAEDKKNPAQYGFGSPVLTVKLTAPSGSQTLIVGKKEGDRYDAMNSALQPVFTVNSEFLTRYQQTADSFRDKDIFSGSPFDAKRLEITTSKGQRVFEMQKDKWKQTAPSAKDEPNDKMDSLLTDLSEIRVTSFPEAKPGDLESYGLSRPAFAIKIVYQRGETDLVEAGVVGDKAYARRASDPLPGEITKASVGSLEKALGQL